MDALEVARMMIAMCVLRGNIRLAREYATDYAHARDDMPTASERESARGTA